MVDAISLWLIPFAYIDNTLSSMPDTSLVLFGIASGSNVACLSRGTFIGISPYVVFNVLLE